MPHHLTAAQVYESFAKVVGFTSRTASNNSNNNTGNSGNSPGGATTGELDLPVFVVVGLQSAGKSTLIESFLNFPFNVVSANIGTRCPLYLTLVNDVTAKTPVCTVDGEPVDHTELWKSIHERSKSIGESSETGFSTKKLEVTVRYQRCFSGTIVDTPGLVSGSGQETIEEIIREEIRPRNRIIICLLKSELDHNVQHIKTFLDRTFTSVFPPEQRRPDWTQDTIFVATHFDQRMAELKHGRSANEFLSNNGAFDERSSEMPYYVSLKSTLIREAANYDALEKDLRQRPQMEKHILSEWKRTMARGDAELRDCGMAWDSFDAEKFDRFLGLENAKAGMVQAWLRKMQTNMANIVEGLQAARIATMERIDTIEKDLHNTNEKSLRSSLSHYIIQFTSRVSTYLDGDLDAIEDLGSYAVGQTLLQENTQWASSRFFSRDVMKWEPLHHPEISKRVENADLALYGGSQYNRVLEHFGTLVNSCAFPAFDSASIASAFGDLHDDHDQENYERAVVKMTQRAARILLRPSIEWLAHRVAYVMYRMHHVAFLDVSRFFPNIRQHSEFLKQAEEHYVSYVQNLMRGCMTQAESMFLYINDSVIHDLPLALSALSHYKQQARSLNSSSVDPSALPHVPTASSSASSSLSNTGGGEEGKEGEEDLSASRDFSQTPALLRPQTTPRGVGGGGLSSSKLNVALERARRAAANNSAAAGGGGGDLSSSLRSSAAGVRGGEWMPTTRYRELDASNEALLRQKAEDQFRGHKFLYVMLCKLICNSYFFKKMRQDGLLEHMNELCLVDAEHLGAMTQQSRVALQEELQQQQRRLTEIQRLIEELGKERESLSDARQIDIFAGSKNESPSA